MWRLLFGNKSKLRSQRRVCCFHFGRCGSTVFANMIASHRNVDWRGEIFHDLHESKTKVEPWGLLDGIIDESTRTILGFETKFQHLDQNAVDLPMAEFLYRLERRKFSHFIILKRKNYLRQAISVVRGQATKTWHFRKSTPQPEFTPVYA